MPPEPEYLSRVLVWNCDNCGVEVIGEKNGWTMSADGEQYFVCDQCAHSLCRDAN